MHTFKNKATQNNSQSVANALATQAEVAKPALQLQDNRPQATIQKKQIDTLGDRGIVAQLKGGGSHGKSLHFKVTTVTIHNSVTGANRYVNANHDEILGTVPSHGAGPAQKTQSDADVVAAGVANLGANETITHINWDHYTSR